MPSLQEIVVLAENSGLLVREQVKLNGRPAQYGKIPDGLHPKVKELLERRLERGLYVHQSRAIEASLQGHNICVGTSTASGKSLIFTAMAAHQLLSDSKSKVIAMYPAKALIQDQILKWNDLMVPLGLSVGHIDGGIPVKERDGVVQTNRVLLMTPDVAQAWLMRSLGEKSISSLMTNLKLLILDEAHVYDGVFGTNMAYFLRRFEVVTGKHQLILSTATLKDGNELAERLTGRQFKFFGSVDEGHDVPDKTVCLASSPAGKSGKQLEVIADLLANLGETGSANGFRFLAFGDSRKLVEQVVVMTQRVITKRRGKESDNEQDEDPADNNDESADAGYKILPYRAGYEETDRKKIQSALSNGNLAGVVSTSALELGIDIGEIDVAVFLGLPPSMKAFWQRLGRAGRKHSAVCLLIDNQGFVEEVGGLAKYMERPLESNWLYLQNRYIQYSHVLCAAFELTGRSNSKEQLTPFDSLPDRFRALLDNELNPKEPVPQDLYELKQRAQAGPHQEFPLRNAVEPNFRVLGPHDLPMGSLSYQYALREAYPGAIYYYMARPYRAFVFNYRQGEIRIRREKRWTTKPNSRVTVFPKFPDGILTSMRSGDSAVIESEMQVSEEVLGFVEQRGPNSEKHEYGPTSPYSQKTLNRFFRTTGVCLCFPQITLSKDATYLLLEAFCTEFSVQERELGIGDFYSKITPAGLGKPIRGQCIYDSTNGSLRLTQQLAENFETSVRVAYDLAQRRSKPFTKQLETLLDVAKTLTLEKVNQGHGQPSEAEWIEVVAAGEMGMYSGGRAGREAVKIIGVRYTPKGAVYDVQSEIAGMNQSLGIRCVEPIFGTTKTCFWNPETGQTREK